MASEREDAAAVRRLAMAPHRYACDRRKDALVAWVDAALSPFGGRLFEGNYRRQEETPDA